MTKIFTLFAVLFSVNLIAQTPCENGEANGYPCNQVDFYSNLDNATLSGSSGVESSDIWGWTDPQTNKEYVIYAQTNGTVFVDISIPSSPVIIGRLPSHTGYSSTWRDVKVYNNHAFIVADNNSGHGMQVFDLTRLRDAGNSIETFDNDAHYDGVSSAHNVVINEETGFAYIVGARGAGNNCGQGGLHIVNIQDPKNPVFAGCFDADGYTHDAQCVIYNGPDTDYQGKELCFNANENTVTIADVSDKENTSLISKQGYSGSAYSHQGWLTEDHKYFISNDELDEYYNGVNTRTLVWDVSDLDNPVLLTQYFSERSGIDHNLYTKDDMIFQTNYTNGLIILDSKEVENGDLRELAYFDTFPQNDNTNFYGAWSNYPYFESGVIAVSDINNGLFLLEPNIKDVFTEHPNFTECGSGEKVLIVGIDDQFQVDNFQWQKTINGNVHSDLEDGGVFSGANTSELTINSITEEIEGTKFRCKVQLTTGETAFSYLSNLPSALPEIFFDYTVSDNLIVRFESTSNNVDSLVWDFGDGSDVSNEENPEHTYAEGAIFEVTLTAFSDCGSDDFSSSVDLTDCLPEAAFTYEIQGNKVIFSNLSENVDEYYWDFGDGSDVSNEENPEHIYTEGTIFEVSLTVFGDCGSDDFSSSVDLTDCLPEAAITYEIQENEVVFSSLSENVDEYYWDFGDGSPISNDPGPIHTYDEPGTYTITLTISNQCGESTITETINLQILNTEEEFDSNFRIYPNPVENVVNISNDNNILIKKFEIFDQKGKRVSYSNNILPSAIISIDMSQKVSGIYYLVLTDNTGKQSNKKIIKK